MSEETPPEALGAGLVLDDGPGPARPLSAAAADAMIAEALARAASGADDPLGEDRARPSNVRRLPLRAVAVGVAVGVTLAAAAGTLIWRATRGQDGARGTSVDAAVAAPVAPAADGVADEGAAASDEGAAVSDEGARDEGARAGVDEAARAGVDQRGAARRGDDEPRRTRAVRRRPQRSDRRPVPPPPAASPGERLAPEDLLAAANALRGERRWAEAERAYRRVVDQHPSSSSAYVAAASAGMLRLERLGDAGGALALLQDARRAQPDGPLDPELRLHIASAFAELGRRDVARRELTELIDRYPTSPQAATARRRLGAL